MNKTDREYLDYLQAMSDEQWEKWVEKQDKAELDRILYLIKLARETDKTAAELKKLEAKERKQDAKGLDCSEALAIINRIKRG
jgi:hypothetical protein